MDPEKFLKASYADLSNRVPTADRHQAMQASVMFSGGIGKVGENVEKLNATFDTMAAKVQVPGPAQQEARAEGRAPAQADANVGPSSFRGYTPEQTDRGVPTPATPPYRSGGGASGSFDPTHGPPRNLKPVAPGADMQYEQPAPQGPEVPLTGPPEGGQEEGPFGPRFRERAQRTLEFHNLPLIKSATPGISVADGSTMKAAEDFLTKENIGVNSNVGAAWKRDVRKMNKLPPGVEEGYVEMPRMEFIDPMSPDMAILYTDKSSRPGADKSRQALIDKRNKLLMDEDPSETDIRSFANMAKAATPTYRDKANKIIAGITGPHMTKVFATLGGWRGEGPMTEEHISKGYNQWWDRFNAGNEAY